MDPISIINGTVIRHDNSLKADLVIEDGVIAEIRRPGYGTPIGQVIDAKGLLVLPGAIDIHFHCRAPAYPERGDFATETRAAAAGGVTAIFEMPISKPGTSTAAILLNRRALAERDAYVDFGLYAAPGLLEPGHILEMVEAGAIAFKTFMTSAPEGREDEFAGLCVTTTPKLLRLLELIKPYPLPAVFHAEDDMLLNFFGDQLQAEGRHDVDAHTASRPPVVESTAIAALIALAHEVGRAIHIAHLSTQAGLELVRDARRRGVPVTAETCPHYLLFTSNRLVDAGPFAKINPPLRSESDRAALWAGLDDGSIEVITTDHSPFTVEEKERGNQNIWLAPPGVPGVEILYPFVLDQAHRQRFSFSRAVELVATRPAQLYNLYPCKGTIQVGSDADLVLYDPKATLKVRRERWFSKAAPCDRLYSGMIFNGRICRTILRGKTIFIDGQVTGQPGDGQFLRPDRM